MLVDTGWTFRFIDGFAVNEDVNELGWGEAVICHLFGDSRKDY